MLIDARTIPENTVIESDVCIIGAGAAGITLAREFSGQKFRVCLLEAGGLAFDEETQSLYRGKNTGLTIELDRERLRYFGGTTNHWEGHCRPMDEEDFEEREWIPDSGWPFRRSELKPYYERAHEICHIGPFIYDIEAYESGNKRHLPFDNRRVITKLFQLVPSGDPDQLQFGQVYRQEIQRSDNVAGYFFANATDLESLTDVPGVNGVRVATLAGNSFWVSARIFVLATGAIENARLLLLSNTVQSAGLGNQNDLVGRYFMAHLEFEAAIFLPSVGIQTDLYARHPVSIGNWSGEIRPFLALTQGVRRHEMIVNFTAEVSAASVVPGGVSVVPEGVRSLQELVRSMRDATIPDNLVTHIGRILADSDDVAIAIYRKLRDHDQSLWPVCLLTNNSETTPCPNSRVTLTNETDQLKKNRVTLHWQIAPIDIDSLKRGYEILGQECGRAGLGRLKVWMDRDLSELSSQHHHMGTTRMHSDPKKGVVNANCQVHGIPNLFIAGSSVFPTSGSATPTLTIIALAVRLADHIKAMMK